MNNITLYRKLMKFVHDSGMRFHDIRIANTFCWAMTGLILSEKISLGQWELHRAGRRLASSAVRQFSRWLHNERIWVWDLYSKLLQQMLQDWKEPFWIAVDTTVLWDTFVMIEVSLIYRDRALPLAWKVLEQSSATVAFAYYKSLLIDVALIIPLDHRTVLLADRGFTDTNLMKLCRDLGWHFRIRAKLSLLVDTGRGQRKLRTLLPQAGKAHMWHNVFISGKQLGPLHLALP